MKKVELNALLDVGPKGAQFVKKIRGDFFLFEKREIVNGNLQSSFSFYNSTTKQNSVWINFENKEEISSNLWLLTQLLGKQCFYNSETNQIFEWFVSKKEISSNLWLLTDCYAAHYLCNPIINQISPRFKVKKEVSNNLWLLIDFVGNYCFHKLTTNQSSDWVVFERYAVDENGLIKCFSEFETYAVLNQFEMKLGNFQFPD